MWFRKGTDQGYDQAQCSLGTMYAKGQGVPQNYNVVLVWFRKAADQGHAVAQSNPGFTYLNGRGVPQNYNKALVWLRRAAAQGHQVAIEKVTRIEGLFKLSANSPASASGNQDFSKCANCGALSGPEGNALKPCGRCKAVAYCGKECQRAHWIATDGHKGSCMSKV